MLHLIRKKKSCLNPQKILFVFKSLQIIHQRGASLDGTECVLNQEKKKTELNATFFAMAARAIASKIETELH